MKKKNSRAKKRGSGFLKGLVVVVVLVAVVLCAAFAMARYNGSGSSSSEAAQSAAGSGAAASSEAGSASAETSRAATSVIDFFIEGETESVPAKLYVGSGYSLYVPSEGWTVSKGDGRVTWISNDNESVGFSITTYKNTTAATARSAYITDSGFEFEDLNGGEFGDPLLGWDEDGDALGIMSAEKNGTVYIIAWTYPEEATEGFGARLQQIAQTFELA